MNAVQPQLHNDAVWRSESGKLLIKRCNACEALFHYPRPMCPFCMSGDTAWVEAKGSGTVYSFAITRQKNADPYVIAYVALDEGVSLLTHIVDTPLERIAIGMPVSVAFRDVDGQAVPMFTQSA
ncbi:MAG: hypothetical protein JWQ73_2758 [Variovorax sp.]|nr:hypothetical protein [Variovorax sp.]